MSGSKRQTITASYSTDLRLTLRLLVQTLQVCRTLQPPPRTALLTDCPGGFVVAGTPTPISPDFENLKSQWATLSPTGVKASAYNPSLSAPPCPSFTSGAWSVNADVALPTLNQKFNAEVLQSITAGGNGNGGSATGSAASVASSQSAAGKLQGTDSCYALVVALSTLLFGFV